MAASPSPPVGRGSLGLRLMLGMLLVLGVGFGASGALQMMSTREALSRQMDGLGTALARSAAASLVEWILERQYTYVQTYVDCLVTEDLRVAFMTVTLPDGKTVLASRPLGDPRHAPEFADCHVYEQDVRVPSSSMSLKAVGVVTLGLRSDQMSDLAAQRTRQTLSTFVATFLVLAVVVGWLLRRMLHDPLSHLDRQTMQLAQGNLEHVVTIDSRTELGRLAHTLELMRVNLKSSYESIARQHGQLLALDRMKAQFLANLSHELRTPLTALIGFTDLLASAGLQAEARSHVETIRRNALHLHALLNELLDLAKLGTGELLIEPAPFDPGELARDLFDFLWGRAAAKSLDLQLHVRDMPCVVTSDPTRVRQVLLHLVGNAIKFTERGSVTLELDRESEGGVHWVVFRVHDTGPGVPEAIRDKLFEPWTQGDAALSRRMAGLGIGLSIAAAITARLGGRIACASRPGEGSTFTLALPLVATEAESSPSAPGLPAGAAQPRPAAAGAGMAAPERAVRVLLAEDAPDNQRLITLMLKKVGFIVTIAENGRRACEAAQRAREIGEPFDIVLMDIQMPELDGCGATRWLREQGFTLPILAITAHSMESDRQRCLEAGCDDYLTKPLVASKLVQCMREHLARAREATPHPV